VRVWIAQGFGIGRIPVAPGTFGSLLGVAWFGLLLLPGRFWVLVLGILVGLLVSVWLCGEAERILGKSDPGSVVLDEITAMPLCFLSWAVLDCGPMGALPRPEHFFSGSAWFLTLGVFAAFRLFDIWKPWPVRQSQSLPGGWGVTVDDFLAAGYVSLLMLLFRLAGKMVGG
jgi:phosphatidylglycerophosphatase A